MFLEGIESETWPQIHQLTTTTAIKYLLPASLKYFTKML